MFVDRKKYFVEFIEIGCDSYRTKLIKDDEQKIYADRRQRITRALLQPEAAKAANCIFEFAPVQESELKDLVPMPMKAGKEDLFAFQFEGYKKP